jgi:hypothetical protein
MTYNRYAATRAADKAQLAINQTDIATPREFRRRDVTMRLGIPAASIGHGTQSALWARKISMRESRTASKKCVNLSR